MYNLQLRMKKILPPAICTLQSSKGFSLVEVMLFLMIVGFIILLLVNIPSSIELIGKTRRINLAKEIVNQKIEGLRLLGFENLPGNGISTFSDARLTTLPSGAGEVVVEDCPSSACILGETNIKQVKVSVKWKEESQDKNLNVTTLITEGGIK